MTKYQKTLLAGVAALAIAAGTGFASAQTRGGGSTGGAAAGGSSATESPSQSGGMSKHQGAAKEHSGSSMKSQADKGDSAEQNGKSSAKNAKESGSSSRSAEEPTKSGKRQAQDADQGSKKKNGTANSEMKRHPNQGTAERERSGTERKKGTAERERSGTERGKGTAERERSLRGLQGNASEPMQGEKSSKGSREGASRGEGANVAPEGSSTSIHLSEQQRTHLKQTIIEGHNAPRADHVDFDVRVGTVVPRGSIHVTTVPETLVRIEPQWRGYEYFVYEDEIVIVDPHDMHIVAVVAV